MSNYELRWEKYKISHLIVGLPCHRFCNFVCLVAVGPVRSKWVTTNDPKFELYGTVCLDGFTLRFWIGYERVLQFEGKWCFGLRYVMLCVVTAQTQTLRFRRLLVYLSLSIIFYVTALFLCSWAGLGLDGPGNTDMQSKVKSTYPSKSIFKEF